MKILVLDDDPVSLKLISSLLTGEGYEVSTVASFRQALSQLDRGFVDLIITDIILPGSDGIDFMKYLKSIPRLRRIPVVVCSAMQDQEAVTRAAELGAKGYIIKPINKERLLEKVHAALKDSATLVMIVDDEPIMRSLLARVVEREGLRALTAASGTEALQLLEANQVRLVISDIVMPDMSGLELLATIKARRPALPVLIITGHASEFRKENVLAAGADGYITKPFKNVEIAQRLASFL